MESTPSKVSGGGTTTSIAKLPADWRRTMNDEMREALKSLDAGNNIDREGGEFTNKDAVGIWRPSISGTKKFIAKLLENEELTMRRAYDPEAKQMVNAYKKANP